MTIHICDPCKKFDNVVTETNKVIRVKGRSYLNMDVCDKHSDEVNNLSMVDYVRYSYKIQGIELTENDDEIKLKYLRK